VRAPRSWVGLHTPSSIKLPSGKLTVCYWKLPFIVDLPMKHCDFPTLCKRLPEGNFPWAQTVINHHFFLLGITNDYYIPKKHPKTMVDDFKNSATWGNLRVRPFAVAPRTERWCPSVPVFRRAIHRTSVISPWIIPLSGTTWYHCSRAWPPTLGWTKTFSRKMLETGSCTHLQH